MAPCPYCESGYREEFPKQDGNHRPTKVPWYDGFWSQKESEDINLEPLYPHGRTELPVEENRAKMEELMERVKAMPSMSKW
jgi:hypothetical protein